MLIIGYLSIYQKIYMIIIFIFFPSQNQCSFTRNSAVKHDYLKKIK